MKPEFTFHYVDEPQFKVSERRELVASALRAYRRHPERYHLQRIGLHSYQVQIRPWLDNCPTAIIRISQ